MDRGARWGTVHGVTKRQTQLNRLGTAWHIEDQVESQRREHPFKVTEQFMNLYVISAGTFSTTKV